MRSNGRCARARLGAEQLELLHAYSFTPDPNFYGYHGPVSQPVDWHIESPSMCSRPRLRGYANSRPT